MGPNSHSLTGRACTPRFHIVLVIMLVSAGSLVADSSVWVATSGDSTVYLGGTFHLLRPSDFPLPAEFEEAYADSDRVFFETDISKMSDPGVLMQMIEKLTYGEEVTLRSVLSDEAYAALSGYLTSIGLPMEAVERFRPGFLTSTLEVLEFQKMGFEPTGVDIYFNERAVADGKPTGILEPLEAQFSFMAAMGQGYESEFILMQLEGITELSAEIEVLIDVWRAGDADELDAIFIEEMRRDDPQNYESLIVKRNHRWMPTIEDLFRQAGTEFVLVGAAHMVGEDGLIRLLEDRGYRVEQR